MDPTKNTELSGTECASITPLGHWCVKGSEWDGTLCGGNTAERVFGVGTMGVWEGLELLSLFPVKTSGQEAPTH